MVATCLLLTFWTASLHLAASAEPLGDETSFLQRSAAVSNGLQLPLLQQGSQQTHTVRHITSVAINLDLPPEERWTAAVQPLKEQMRRSAAEGGPVDRTLLDDIDFTPDEELLAEMRGIVKAVDSPNYTLEHLLASEIIYERGFTACTGVLAATPDGTVLHGRNLDLDPAICKMLQQIVWDVTYYSNGQPLFATSTFGLSVGAHTGYRIGAYSIAQNTRNGCGDLERNAQAARHGGRPFGLQVRRILQEVATYEEAVHRLAIVPLIAPQYFTVAGKGAWEGALVTRDRHGVDAPYANVEVLSPQIGRWYIVQTNDDTWRPPADARRPAALSKLSNLSSLNADTLLDVMMTEPVLNNGTIFTWILNPATGMRRVFLGADEMSGNVEEPAFVTSITVPPMERKD